MRYLPVDESLQFNIQYLLPLHYRKYKIKKSKVYYIAGDWGEYFSQDGKFNGFGYEYNLSNTGGNMVVKGLYRNPVICILYTLKGGLAISAKENMQDMNAGKIHILYLPKGTVLWHLIDDYCTWFTLIVKPTYIKSLFKSMEQTTVFFKSIVTDPEIPHIIDAGGITQSVKKQVIAICKYRSQSPEWELTLSAYGKNLLVALSNALRKKIVTADKIITAETVSEFVLEHIESTITIESISRAFGLNTTAVKKLFRKIFNSTVHNFILQQRMSVAKELLLTTSNSVYTIAMCTGFSDISHFVRQFKNRVGLTPTAFRAHNKDDLTR